MQLPLHAYTLEPVAHVRLSDLVGVASFIGGEYAYTPKLDADGDTLYTLGQIERANETSVTVVTVDGDRRSVRTSLVYVVIASPMLKPPEGVTFGELSADPAAGGCFR
jgi:hypothetical protein